MLLNSGGINGDMAFWGVGDQWVFYGGGTFIGIQMRDGKVFWYQNSTTGDSIGTYIVGEPITITLNLNTNGTLTAKSSRFNSTITPASLPSTKKWMMASANSTLRQGFQVWSAGPPPLISAADERLAIPSMISLRQNYPNPFNPSTTIEYQLPSRGSVQINIYNSLGQLVKTLVNGEVNEAGGHSISWNGRNNEGDVVSSGAYFYQIRVNDQVQAKRMLLLK